MQPDAGEDARVAAADFVVAGGLVLVGLLLSWWPVLLLGAAWFALAGAQTWLTLRVRSHDEP